MLLDSLSADTRHILTLAPVQVKEFVDSLTPESRHQISRDLESLAYFSVAYGTYCEERYGYGCSDQGHASADKAACKATKTLWTKVFGYHQAHRITTIIPSIP